VKRSIKTQCVAGRQPAAEDMLVRSLRDRTADTGSVAGLEWDRK